MDFDKMMERFSVSEYITTNVIKTKNNNKKGKMSKSKDIDINNYVLTDSVVSRNLLYQKINNCNKVFGDSTVFKNTSHENEVQDAILKCIDNKYLFFSDVSREVSLTEDEVKEDEFDYSSSKNGCIFFAIPNDRGSVDLVTNSGCSIFCLSNSIENAKKLNEDISDRIIKYINDNKKEQTLNTKISLLMRSNSYYFEQVNIDTNNIKSLDNELELHYGQGFKEKHEKVLHCLKNNKKGLYILSSAPGLGKTTYLRYLISKITNKKIIFIPPFFTDFLSSPEFLPTLLNDGGKNCILIIEDAEKAVISREDNPNGSSAANLLNISDGILSDCLNAQIICTFNTDVKNIDKALLRAGRLTGELKFDPLSIEASQKLLDYLNKKGIIGVHKAKKPMTLAEIYNVEVNNFHIEKKLDSIGFQFK